MNGVEKRRDEETQVNIWSQRDAMYAYDTVPYDTTQQDIVNCVPH